MDRRRLVIVGAAGRDFHNFNLVYRGREEYEVVAFTATQIPNIEGRRYPAELAGHLYPAGIPIHPESKLEELVREHDVDEVVFSYSDVTHEHVMHIGSRVLAAGASYSLLSPHRTMLTSSRPVVAVCAVRTGSGKSQTTRHIAKLLRDDGKRVAVLRHPMPYGDLTKQAVQRFADYADLEAADATIEEREEYEPHIAEGNVVFAGIDYAAILDEAEQEADVILWDGGNNDTPFIKPNLHVVVVDPHRPGHELRYHPGETNLRMAHVCVVNKVDTAPPDGIEAVLDSIRKVNPGAKVVRAASPFLLEENGETIAGKRVLAIEDGPTLTRRDGVRSRSARRQGKRRRRARRSPAVRGRVDREDPGGVPARHRAAPGHGLRPQADGRAQGDDRALGRRPRADRDSDRPAARHRLRQAGTPRHLPPSGARRADPGRPARRARAHHREHRTSRRLTTVVALGGNALIRAGDRGTAAEQAARLRETADALAPLLREGNLVITHGNGPQVGNELLRQERSADEVPPLPLYLAVAQTQAEIGSMIETELGPAAGRPVACLLTHVVVEESDPAFGRPTKPIGPFYSAEQARALEEERGWQVVEEAGRGWRRVVPPPRRSRSSKPTRSAH